MRQAEGERFSLIPLAIVLALFAVSTLPGCNKEPEKSNLFQGLFDSNMRHYVFDTGSWWTYRFRDTNGAVTMDSMFVKKVSYEDYIYSQKNAASTHFTGYKIAFGNTAYVRAPLDEWYVLSNIISASESPYQIMFQWRSKPDTSLNPIPVYAAFADSLSIGKKWYYQVRKIEFYSLNPKIRSSASWFAPDVGLLKYVHYHNNGNDTTELLDSRVKLYLK